MIRSSMRRCARATAAKAFREAFDIAILPRIEAFRPDLIVISAGFDAHRRDPLGHLNLVEADYAWATRRLMAIADKSCKGPRSVAAGRRL